VSLLSFARNTTLAVIFYGVPIAVPSTSSASEPDEDQLIDFASIIQITFEQNLETALQRETISESEEHLLSNLVEETQRLKTITRSLLLFSQSDAGNLKLESKPFDLSSTIQALLEDAQSLDAANDLSFKIDLEKRIIAHGDQTLLRQAIHNLLTNAVRYNHSNGVVGISLHKKPGLLTIRVSNTGPGISPTNQNKVFDRFFRADFSRTRKHESFGLGLPLAREIAKAHGGNIVLVASNSEKTTFEFKLPTDKLK